METDSARDAIRAAKNEALLRSYNEQVEARHRSVRPSFARWLCECADANCAEPVSLSIEEYEAIRKNARRFLVVPANEHVSPGLERVVQREERYWVVEKVGVGAKVSEELDPRS
jgi:hypothetical protein